MKVEGSDAEVPADYEHKQSPQVSTEDLEVPIALRKSGRNIRLPWRYRDVLPSPSPSLPLTRNTVVDQSPSFLRSDVHQGDNHINEVPPAALRSGEVDQPLRSPQNIFGLVREYTGTAFPDHDAEEHLSLSDLCIHSASSRNLTDATPHSDPLQSFFPYPNASSFALGHWYWNEGERKTQAGFRELIKIVGAPEFSPSDVQHNDWDRINTMLGDNRVEGDGDWIDAADEGWNVTNVQIHVPFDSGTATPGKRLFQAISLHHRSLISVTRERIGDPHDFRYFHTEPYKLLWKPPLDSTKGEVHVHGELYTSQAFLRAHNELQRSPREPGCQLTRVICALMFWSDGTHLTSFGTAKLWPAYVFFGNETKYRRGKPSCNSCNHVAYFEKVPHYRRQFNRSSGWKANNFFGSYLLNLLTSRGNTLAERVLKLNFLLTAIVNYFMSS